VTMEMSDSDYAVLRHVVGWLEQHAGKDAPEYPELDAATRVVNNIARRRERDSSKRPRLTSPFTRAVVDVRPATVDAEPAGSASDDSSG